MFVVCENLTIQHRHVKHYFYFYERVDLTVSRGSHRVSGLVQYILYMWNILRMILYRFYIVIGSFLESFFIFLQHLFS